MNRSSTIFFHILLLFAITFFATLIASLLTVGAESVFTYFGFQTMQNPWFDYVRLALQTCSIFGIPAMSIKYFDLHIVVFPFCYKKDKKLMWISILTWIFCILPVYGLWELNKSIKFPVFLSEMEETLRHMQSVNESFMNYLLAYRGIDHFLVLTVVVAILPAIFEELFFRGILQQLLYKFSSNIWVAILTTSVVFSVFHMEFYALLPRILLGALLGIAFAASGKLWLPMLIHFLNNFLGLATQQFVSKPQMDNLSQMGVTSYGWIVTVLSLLLVLWFFWFMSRGFAADRQNLR